MKMKIRFAAIAIAAATIMGCQQSANTSANEKPTAASDGSVPCVAAYIREHATEPGSVSLSKWGRIMDDGFNIYSVQVSIQGADETGTPVRQTVVCQFTAAQQVLNCRG